MIHTIVVPFPLHYIVHTYTHTHVLSRICLYVCLSVWNVIQVCLHTICNARCLFTCAPGSNTRNTCTLVSLTVWQTMRKDDMKCVTVSYSTKSSITTSTGFSITPIYLTQYGSNSKITNSNGSSSSW